MALFFINQNTNTVFGFINGLISNLLLKSDLRWYNQEAIPVIVAESCFSFSPFAKLKQLSLLQSFSCFIFSYFSLPGRRILPSFLPKRSCLFDCPLFSHSMPHWDPCKRRLNSGLLLCSFLLASFPAYLLSFSKKDSHHVTSEAIPNTEHQSGWRILDKQCCSARVMSGQLFAIHFIRRYSRLKISWAVSWTACCGPACALRCYLGVQLPVLSNQHPCHLQTIVTGHRKLLGRFFATQSYEFEI